MGCITFVTVLALLVLQCLAGPIQRTWKYEGRVNAYNVASEGSNPLMAVWGISSRVVVQDFGGHCIVKFKDVKTTLFNGYLQDLPNEEDNTAYKDIHEDFHAILKTVTVYYEDITNITIVHEADDPVWSVNMKRGFISTFLNEIPEKEDSTVQQHTLYGSCNVTYNVQHQDTNYVVEKTIEYVSCKDSPSYDVSIKTWNPTSREHRSINKDIKYTYTYNGTPSYENLKKIHTHCTMSYQSVPAVRSVQKIVQIKDIVFLSETDTFEKFDTSNITVHSNITYDYSKGYKGGRTEKIQRPEQELVTEFNENFEKFKEYFETIPIQDNPLKINDSIWGMFGVLKDMTKDNLQKLSTDIFAKDNNLYQQMFLSYLPYLGTEESIKFIRALIENEDENLNDLLAIKILSTFPVYLDDHSEELLKEMEPLTHLKVSNNQVKYAGILSFASMVDAVKKNDKVDKKTFQKYVNLYYQNFIEADDYELKMTYLLGLINFNGDFTNDMIEICADTNLSHHLRTLAIFGFKKNLISGVPETYTHFWSMVKNQTEHYEIRVAALDLLLYSDLSYNHFQNIINWYYDEFENPDEQHLIHYLYTTIQSLENSTGNYEYLGAYATEAFKTMKPIEYNRVWTTGNYRWAFTNDGNYGGSLQTRLIANPNSNVINLGIFSLETFAISFNLGSYTAYVKTQGIPDLGFLLVYLNSRENENPVQYLMDLIKKHGYKLKEIKDAHIEVVLFSNNRVVYGMHINKNNVDNYSDNPLFLDFLKLVIDYNSLSFPLLDCKYLVASDLGTKIQVCNEIFEVSSYELENIDKIIIALSDNSSEKINAIEYNFKYRSIWTYLVLTSSHNPLIGANIETNKLVKDELWVNIPYAFNFTKSVFKWKHANDSFNYLKEHVIGTYADRVHLGSYCEKCDAEINTPFGEKGTNTGLDILESVLGFHFNITEAEKSVEQRTLERYKPSYNYPDYIEHHKTNTFSFSVIQPILFLWNIGLYNTFIANDICSISIRTEPYYDELTESVFHLDFDANDIKTDRDPITESEFDCSIAFTNRKSHNAEVLNYINASVIYKTKSESPETETQPHIEHNVEFKLYYEDRKNMKSKVCVDREILYPNRRVDKFSLEPVDPTKATTKIHYGIAEKFSDDWYNHSFTITEIYTGTEKQKQHMESLEEYDKCKKESKGLKYIPPTYACLASHKVISKYDSCIIYAESSDGKYIVKVLEYTRLNETYVNVSITERFLGNIINQIVNTDNFIVKNDLNSLMSLSPSVVAYDDYDLIFGVSSVCYITPNEIRTFHGNVIRNYNTEFGPDAVAFVECVNNTQAGMTIQRLGKNSVGFNLWTEGNNFVASVDNGKTKAVYNGQDTSETDIKDDDFKIYFLDQNVIYATNRLLDIQYTTEYISIKIPSIYNNYICGLCSGNKQ